MKSPPILQDNDADAEAQAARARADGETLIRDHLANHLVYNKGASSDYISWLATLHPENAEITIDQRFFIPGNPWWSIYDETVNQMPYATAVAVQNGDDQPTGNDQLNGEEGGKHPLSSGEDSHAAASAGASSHGSLPPHYLLNCSPIDVLVGSLTTFHAILGTVIMELVALIIYFIAAFFYHCAKAMGRTNLLNGFLYSLCMILYFSFALADSILLCSSVLVTEILDMTGWLLGCLFGGVLVANLRHQFVRRICHHIRWAFRRHHLDPPRSWCKETATVGNVDEEDDGGISNPTTEVVNGDVAMDIEQNKDAPLDN